MLVLAPVPVRDARQHELAVGARFELNLGDAREIFAQLVAVALAGRPEIVDPDGLVKRQIGRGALSGVWVAREEQVPPVSAPSDAAAGGAAIDARDDVAGLLAGVDVVDVDTAVFAAVSGE